MKFDIITIFPKIFDGFLGESLLARAQKKLAQKGRGLASGGKIISIKIHNLRKWAKDKHKTVDDRPFGGGPGMVMKFEPIYKAATILKSKSNSSSTESGRGRENKNAKFRSRVILFSPRGKKFTQADVQRLSKYSQLIFICGRYEGVDERVANHVADEVFSIGDYVLNGGEVAAMVLIESISRMIPSFIAKKESAIKEDFAQYTRPEVVKINGKKIAVPKVLLGGNHKEIDKWRRTHK